MRRLFVLLPALMTIALLIPGRHVAAARPPTQTTITCDNPGTTTVDYTNGTTDITLTWYGANNQSVGGFVTQVTKGGAGTVSAPTPATAVRYIATVLSKRDPSFRTQGACGSFSDLVITAIALDSTPYGYTVTVKNQGAAAADLTSVGVQGYWSPDATYSPATDDPACGTSFSSGTLAANATTTIHVTCSLGPSSTDQYLTVMVDDSNVLPESDETNNTFALPLT